MPKRDDAPDLATCAGCGMELPADDLTEAGDLRYCSTCAERRASDPTVFVQGRTLAVSELRMQAEDDEHLAAALDGDTVQEALKAAKAKR